MREGGREGWSGEELLAAPLNPESEEEGWSEVEFLVNRSCWPPLPTIQ